MMDWLKQRMMRLLGEQPLQGELDLCDETGNLRLLWALPATVTALDVLVPRAAYHLVVRPTTDAQLGFQLVRPFGGPEVLRGLQDRLQRALAAWERVQSHLPADLPTERLVEVVNKSVSRQATRMQSRRAGSPLGSADKWSSVRDRLAASPRSRQQRGDNAGRAPPSMASVVGRVTASPRRAMAKV
ncbi:uncharacterized protein LOC119091379 isoform X2 [Pollicipes pollicipes]|nr:uncharacterized protein LOC119091379 isoform X2 [Pollicipes pollicipes]